MEEVAIHVKLKNSIMANSLKRLSRSMIDDDRQTFLALKNIPDYSPLNKDVEISKVEALEQAMQAAQDQETLQEHMLNALRDKSTLAERDFHDAITECKQQVRAQYGPNSDEVNSIGLKKKMDYQRRVRKTTTQ